jgi:hypothetical protein
MIELIESNFLFILVSILTLFVISVALNIATLVKTKKIEASSKKFFSGKNGKDLEELLTKNIEHIESMDDDIQELFKASNEIYELSSKSIHKVGMIRFNPFKDLGGNQSFALALLDGKNSGIVISSLHTREGTRIYSKSIQNSECKEHNLTEEEKSAIKKATENSTEKKPKKK